MRFPRPEYWSGLSFPSPGDLPDQGYHSRLLHWQVGSSPLCRQGRVWGEEEDAVFISFTDESKCFKERKVWQVPTCPLSQPCGGGFLRRASVLLHTELSVRDLREPVESGQGWGVSLSRSQLRSHNWFPASFPFFSSLSPPGEESWRARTPVVTLMGEAPLLPLAVAASGGLCSCSKSWRATLPGPPSPPPRLAPSLQSAHRLLQENLHGVSWLI